MAWSAEAVAAAWARQDVARAVAEIEDAAAALRWEEAQPAAQRNVRQDFEEPAPPQLWIGVGTLWASIAAVTVGMVGGLAFLMR